MGKIDLLVYNGNIITLDPQSPIARWLAIQDGKIVDIGYENEYKKYFPICIDTIDLKGRTMVPGFYDSHVHLVQTGLNILSLDLSHVKSIEEILKKIEEESKITPEGKFIRAIGLDELKIKEKRLPNRYELDQCAPNHPVWINRVEYHTSIVNSMALHMLKIPYNTDGIIRNENGTPSGVLTGRASAIVRKQILNKFSNRMRLKGVNKVLEIAIEKGITSLNAMEGGFTFHDKDAEFVYENMDNFPIDISLFYQTVNVNKVIEKKLSRIGGGIFIDGSFGSRTAALKEPYIDDSTTNGKLYFTQEDLNSFILKTYEKKLQISVHAIGERAIEQILTAHEYAQKIYPRKNHRNRIEHFELPTKEHINRAKNLGLIVSMQPSYEYFWGHKGQMYEKRLGEERRVKANPFKEILKQGLMIAAGSESDVTPLDPILGIYAAVNHPVKEHRIRPLDALKMFTIHGAYAVFEEDIKGSIEKGKYADLVILNEDPLKIDSTQIKNIKVLVTIKEGNILYETNLR
ncbi:amidohydrolase [Anaerophilus nitritogenes]|uniref:amidohydrolase n=1 Tax=Anaerophilus nitritogenes TaxID=2498136 RepID=UPI00101E1A56|nr:amidohydrolase [Anaerophilus nitritogenes]